MKDRQLVIDYLLNSYNYTYENAINWLNSSNANFGMSSPESLIEAGRVDKVMLYLIAVKEGYSYG